MAMENEAGETGEQGLKKASPAFFGCAKLEASSRLSFVRRRHRD